MSIITITSITTAITNITITYNTTTTSITTTTTTTTTTRYLKLDFLYVAALEGAGGDGAGGGSYSDKINNITQLYKNIKSSLIDSLASDVNLGGSSDGGSDGGSDDVIQLRYNIYYDMMRYQYLKSYISQQHLSNENTTTTTATSTTTLPTTTPTEDTPTSHPLVEAVHQEVMEAHQAHMPVVYDEIKEKINSRLSYHDLSISLRNAMNFHMSRVNSVLPEKVKKTEDDNNDDNDDDSGDKSSDGGGDGDWDELVQGVVETTGDLTTTTTTTTTTATTGDNDNDNNIESIESNEISFDSLEVLDNNSLWISKRDSNLKKKDLIQTTRIGISKAKNIKWRWYLKNSRSVSKRLKGDRTPKFK